MRVVGAAVRLGCAPNGPRVADLDGDGREEIVVLNGSSLRVYENTAPNPRPNEPRLWDRREYRRAKQSWNYYSP